MITTHEDERATHARVWSDLSWYVNGTLEDEATARVEEHVRTCAGCREELAAQRVLRSAVAADPAVEHVPQLSCAKLLGRIDASERRRLRWRRIVSWFGRAAARAGFADDSLVGPRPGASAVALSAQMIVLVALLGLCGWLIMSSSMPAQYRTLTSQESEGLAAPAWASRSNAYPLRIVFDDATSAGDVRALLQTLNAHIVDGPSSAGVFTIVLDPVGETQAGREAALQWLREQPVIRFAEPALP